MRNSYLDSMILSNWKMLLASVLMNYSRKVVFSLFEFSFVFFSSFSSAVMVFFLDSDSAYRLSTRFLRASSCFKA